MLLDSTQSYHKEIARSEGDIPEAVKKLLPKLRDEKNTQVVIVTLPETTPVHEAQRLQKDLSRAGLHTKWWVINSSLYAAKTTHEVLQAKASNEIQWINQVSDLSEGHFALIEWKAEEIKGDQLFDLME